ncbi:hypothetical protein BRADI_2g35161v3 [Brachypodium distachyon]|uniref:Uncharacterized protein n=1 Tax=Brachypodium distachyon TaxID=15368 RepID=A0A2K2DBW4_BRADI|nr:hypothetical protein BRADI_2g35161v3 [Brachypodium distachyon]
MEPPVTEGRSLAETDRQRCLLRNRARSPRELTGLSGSGRRPSTSTVYTLRPGSAASITPVPGNQATTAMDDALLQTAAFMLSMVSRHKITRWTTGPREGRSTASRVKGLSTRIAAVHWIVGLGGPGGAHGGASPCSRREVTRWIRSVGRDAQPLASVVRRSLQGERVGKEGPLRFLPAGAKGGSFLPITDDLGSDHLLHLPPACFCRPPQPLRSRLGLGWTEIRGLRGNLRVEETARCRGSGKSVRVFAIVSFFLFFLLRPSEWRPRSERNGRRLGRGEGRARGGLTGDGAVRMGKEEGARGRREAAQVDGGAEHGNWGGGSGTGAGAQVAGGAGAGHGEGSLAALGMGMGRRWRGKGRRAAGEGRGGGKGRARWREEERRGGAGVGEAGGAAVQRRSRGEDGARAGIGRRRCGCADAEEEKRGRRSDRACTPHSTSSLCLAAAHLHARPPSRPRRRPSARRPPCAYLHSLPRTRRRATVRQTALRGRERVFLLLKQCGRRCS